ncbi:iron-sulfur cluster protein ISCU, partial [Cardiosporidium cionae]
VHDHFRKPRNVGSFDKNETGVGTALVGKAACGDVIKLQVKVDNGRIVDAKFKVSLSLRNTDIADHLSLPPVKLHCSMLAEDAIKLAIKDYQAKYPNIKEGSVE